MFAPAPPPFAGGQPSQPSICQEAEQPRPFPSEQPQADANPLVGPPPTTSQSAALPRHRPTWLAPSVTSTCPGISPQSHQ